MKRARSLFAALALGALSAGCTWLVGVSGDVQLAAPTDATAAHDGADAEAATDATSVDSIDESADGWTRGEDGAPPPDGNADVRDDGRG